MGEGGAPEALTWRTDLLLSLGLIAQLNPSCSTQHRPQDFAAAEAVAGSLFPCPQGPRAPEEAGESCVGCACEAAEPCSGAGPKRGAATSWGSAQTAAMRLRGGSTVPAPLGPWRRPRRQAATAAHCKGSALPEHRAGPSPSRLAAPVRLCAVGRALPLKMGARETSVLGCFANWLC